MFEAQYYQNPKLAMHKLKRYALQNEKLEEILRGYVMRDMTQWRSE
ncbi:MAG: hypothetical protein HY361_04805 [Candidatus Aenigmarchaeota archaeon]|nr:hypothetical protein [Candidatus Aenigmarchaeota archaeon]